MRYKFLKQKYKSELRLKQEKLEKEKFITSVQKSISENVSNELIRNIRLETAKQFLSEGVPVSETAYNVGFSNLSNFSKCYKEKFGRSLGEV